MKKNSKKFKKIAPALLVGLIAVGGASAWISTKETQTGINKIKTGTMTLKFIDTKDVDPNGKTRAETVINLSGNDMIPMTEKFANDTLSPYNFTLKNSGSVDLKYRLYLVKEESNFEPNVLSVDIDGANNSYTGVDNSERQLLTTGTLKAGEHKTYDKFILFADENQEVANMINGGVGNTAKFHLEVDAVQVNGEFDNTPSTPPQETITLNTADKIEIEGKEYTVIEQVQGNQYKVLATDTFQHRFDANSNEYVNSEIATYLDNDYYNSLPENTRNAIVETSIQQKALNNWSSNNPTDWGAPINAGKHKVFIPSWDEVTKIYGTTPEGLKAYALNNWFWLRDTYGIGVLNVFNNGNLDFSSPNNNRFVRPAFVLDLSKISFTKK